jgi:tetraacyldisaccharide 4'-kinase
VSTAFRFLVHARDRLYTSGVLSTLKLNHPVVSIGNLTVGGTGKTPLVISIAEQFRDRGYHPVVLSRGYGRTTRGIREAGSDWQECGDEPLLIRRRLGNVPVVVGADRYRAGCFAERKQLGDVFILDDGFQHRRLRRDVDIVTIDPAEWAAGDVLLPTGRWREPKSAISRAHIACVQEKPGIASPALTIPSFTVQTEIQGIYKDDAPVPLEALKGRPITAFAGIAKPERFFEALRSLGIHPATSIRFRDHHHYSRREIEKLGDAGGLLITTEKDAVRLAAVTNVPYCYLRISAKIPDFERLMSIILDRLPK